ncbi:class I adenylate-forming enzyme family protein [Streptomyces sp. OR43]|uniref:class I adenylate-forming enzyme family protein n=1 Tax=Streptomyces sp. or43 TaxID=2478957 RepID=UPI0011CE4ABA|nr:AMP-binding protein [Streptomyces sp. or43]TXS39878.1 AMP-dependent synthetase [Streptomyces sp. or43]
MPDEPPLPHRVRRILADGATVTMADGVRERALDSPGRTAVIDAGRALTFAAVHERSNRLAQALLGAGLVPGDPVAVLLGNCLEYPEVAAALAKAGLPMVPLGIRQTGPEIGWIVGHSGARALIVQDDRAEEALVAVAASGDRIAAVLTVGRPGVGRGYEEALAAAPDRDPLVRISGDDIFCVQYTSGTTGRPKGALLTHRGRALTALLSAHEWGLGAGRTSLAVAPMSHGAGFMFGFAPVLTGGTVVMLPRWDPARMLDLAEKHRVQSMFLVPTHAQTIRALGEDAPARYRLDALDTLYFNAAALPVPLKEWVLDAFPGCGVHELYGSTEGGVVTDLRPVDARRKAGSVGRAWYLTDVRVVDDEGRPVPPGEPGELFSASPFLMAGYLDDPGATAACRAPDGALSVGDVATMDDEGYVTIVDRKTDLIVSGGLNVYPREVEEALLLHPAVAECAVAGTADPVWGERVTAFVVWAPGVPPAAVEDLAEYLRPRLAGYKLPRRLEVLDRLPRNAAGKVLKRELRDGASPLRSR